MCVSGDVNWEQNGEGERTIIFLFVLTSLLLLLFSESECINQCDSNGVFWV